MPIGIGAREIGAAALGQRCRIQDTIFESPVIERASESTAPGPHIRKHRTKPFALVLTDFDDRSPHVAEVAHTAIIRRKYRR